MPVEPDTASGGWFYLLFAMLLVGVTIIAMLGRMYVRYKQGVEGTKLTMEEARSEFGELMSERLAYAMRSAELDKLIVDRWDQWPLEYRPALYQVLRHTQLLEETLFEEAIGRGIYTRRMLEGPLLPPYVPDVVSPSSNDDVTGSEATPVPSNVVPLRGMRWISGQLMRVVGG
jgi:hypothetical protein